MKKQVVNYTAALSLTCVFSACGDMPGSKAPAAPQQETQGASKTMSVITSPSGLKREILQAAPEGAKSPERGKKVTVHYTGWLEEKGAPGAPSVRGKKFDSSVDRGQKFSFIIGVGQVIQGWDEGVMAMKVGEKCRLTIPASIGYGTRGAGAVIPPNATLIFDVELFECA